MILLVTQAILSPIIAGMPIVENFVIVFIVFDRYYRRNQEKFFFVVIKLLKKNIKIILACFSSS